MFKSVSVGVIAYNEESNIQLVLGALQKQALRSFSITEIIVVSSGCNDKTEDIVKQMAIHDQRIVLISEVRRNGKFSAINLFLAHASSEFLILESGDTIPELTAIEFLCTPLLSKEVGIVAARPMPQTKPESITEFAFDLQWRILDKMSQEQKPKFGELIAFKPQVKNIPPTIVDEEEIAKIIIRKGFIGTYCPDAIVYNKAPTSIRTYIQQRRRIYTGHMILKHNDYYRVSTYNPLNIAKYFFQETSAKTIRKDLTSALIEIFARFLAIIDFHLNSSKHIIWKVTRPNDNNTYTNI